MKKITYYILIVLFLGCTTKKSNNILEVKNSDTINIHSDLEESGSQKTVDFDTFHFSSKETSELAKLSYIDIPMMHITGDTLNICTGEEISCRPFGYECFVDTFLLRNQNLFKIIDQKEERTGKVTILKYNDSEVEIREANPGTIPDGAEGLAEYNHIKPDIVSVTKAIILDNEIQMIYGIHLGISKENFFSKFFPDNKYDDILESIHFVNIFHIAGDSPYSTFYFSKGVLIKISIGY